ncbi:esterase/lipase family protein [Flavobacterium ginsenosidimutans]|uniref:Alpha/beta fold hydrolase n=1 Tax=Flavobacterium ginsenosidimutans TaxID=687844 RepID=A0ABZ2Q3A0_9FLAO|nr:alpha/beta fold hydrolase [Flavobacterium ginsenosidimutans]KAF2328166.1 alpha/beta hydrolase [Flavobacterium ginsenosidimutans]
MATNHTTSIEIKHGANTQGYFSFESPENLIVFVHGFGGSALGTWNNFPLILLFDDHFKNSDIVFYGYDTFKGQAGDHAAELYHFINLAFKPLHNQILPSLQNLPERDYKRIVLVAHSLGAVLIRQAQLHGHIAGDDWVEKSELALYAPAHHGAEVISLAMQALPGLSGLFGLFVKFRFPILNDLDSKNNGILDSIKNQTSALQNGGEGNFSKAKLVVYSKGDKIVRNFNYLEDSPAHVIPNTTHISVCKPKDAFITPVELLKQII